MHSTLLESQFVYNVLFRDNLSVSTASVIYIYIYIHTENLVECSVNS